MRDAIIPGFLEKLKSQLYVQNVRVLIGIRRKMVYRIDNRKKKHRGRYTALGLVFGIILTLGGVYVYENYQQPIINDAQVIKNKVDFEVEKAKPVIEKAITPLDNSVLQSNQIKSTIPKTINVSELEHSVHDEINNIRIQNGLKPLFYDENLATIARNHSQDMAINSYFDHTSLDGKSLDDRYRNAGYICFGWKGENIQENFISSDLTNSIVQVWMNSEGHKENILQTVFSHEGIGVYVYSNNIMVTEDFC